MLKNPEWLKQRAPNQESLKEMEKMLRSLSLNTVCESANCPNIGKCFENKTATFMIMGEMCTRGCRFCAVKKGKPSSLDAKEPHNVALACKRLGLKHVVITSVTRDDLKDGGAEHFAEAVKEIRKLNPQSSIELLIPDLKGDWDDLKKITQSKPDIINHNIETVPSLYKRIRPQAVYQRSLELLKQVKVLDNRIFTKSSLMLGLEEKEDEVIRAMEDLRIIGCDILTLGQYLQPSKRHTPVHEYITPEKFDKYKQIALNMGYAYVAAGPLVRSSYQAHEGMKKMTKGVVGYE